MIRFPGGPAVAKDETTKREAASGRQIAVALAYTPETRGDAPKVVATGRGATARRILDLAFQHGVNVREDADLAQILAAVDVDSVIPLEAFMAVAEILAHVYRANNRPPPPLAAFSDKEAPP
jgi:flagellar biosynthesis protein